MNFLFSNQGKNITFTVLFAACLGIGFALSSTLVWKDMTYTSGSLSRTYTDVQSSGIDAVIRIMDSANILSGSSPEINTVLLSGQPIGSADNLYLNINPGNFVDSITVTVSFLETGTSNAAQVNNVFYTLFDIDRSAGNTWQEEVLNFQATDSVSGGPAFGPTVTPVNASNVTITGSGTTISALGVNNVSNSSDQANVGVDFGSGRLTEFSFEYKQDIRTGSPSSIGLYNIEFSVIPEPATWHVVTGLGLLVLIGRERRLLCSTAGAAK